MITPEQLHNWYLEAVKELNPESYNEKANVPFDKLTKEQQFIDKYIANKIRYTLQENKEIKTARNVLSNAWVICWFLAIWTFHTQFFLTGFFCLVLAMLLHDSSKDKEV